MARRKPIAEVATNTPAARKADTWAIERVKPYEKNAKKHPTKQVEHLAKLIRDHGFDQPIVVDKDGVIIKGHGRLLAAQHLKMQAVPVVVRDDLTEAQVRAARIADNKVAEMGAWDMPMLIDDVKLAMDLEGFDLEALGFNVSFVNQHLRLAGELQEVDMPTVPKKPVAKPGQVWQLGEHRIVCGSCADLKNIEQATLKKKARLMVTDPPYGVAYEGGSSAKNKREAILNDALDDMRSFWVECFKSALTGLAPGAAYYVTGPSGDLMLELLIAMRDAGMPSKHALVWMKNSLVMGRSDYQYQHEPMFYGWVDGGPHKAVADRSETSVWQIAKPSKSELHPTMKPIELYARAMRNSSDENDLVLEPFSGSGTAIMAAEQLGRRVAAVELSPGYVDVAIMRWEELTGGKATRD